jgi:hypothetical protein
VVAFSPAAAGCGYQSIATEGDWRAHPAPGQMVDVGGRRGHIGCAGQGSPTVILETGLGAWSSHWALIQPAVADVTRVCSYDRAGLYPTEVLGMLLADATPVDLFERLPAQRANFAAVEQQAHTFQSLAPFGLVRLAIGGALADLGSFPRSTIEGISDLVEAVHSGQRL